MKGSFRKQVHVVGSELLLANQALNALAAHIAVLDTTGVIVFVNEAWSRFARNHGGVHGADAYVGTNYLAVCQDAAERGDSTARAALSGIEDVLRSARDQFELEYPCDAPDQERWFRMCVTGFATGFRRYLVVSHDNITRQKQHERALQESERLVHSVLEALPIGVWILGPDGHIVQGNAAGVRIWAGARYVGPSDFGQYKGWWVATGKPVAAEEWAATRAIRNGETSIDEEIEIECFDGTHKIILNSAVPLCDSEGRITGAIIVNQDITARKRAETEREAMLREQDRLRSAAEEANQHKDEFIATLSHELRTPLHAVIGWTSILKRALPDPQASARAAAAIERNATIQMQLLNDTLDVSRIVRGQLTLEESEIELGPIVADVLDMMRPAANDKEIALVEKSTGGQATLRGDPTRLQQIIWNLVANAVKFTPAGGSIEVCTEVTGESAAVSVRDTGVGIAPEFMPFLFDRFRQGEGSVARARLGLGLGLAIVKELVELHRGTITAESPGEGRGATFTVRFPVVTTRDAVRDQNGPST